MAVTLGRTVVLGVEPGSDTSVEAAIETAKALRAANTVESVTRAIVDANDGLVVFCGDADTATESGNYRRGWHFATLTCGFAGPSSTAAAHALELFGFGDRLNLVELIRHGGERAYYHFRKGVGLVDSGR